MHHHHLVNLGEPNRVVFPLINMTMKTGHIRFVGTLYKNHTLRNRRHSQEIVVVKYSLENTPQQCYRKTLVQDTWRQGHSSWIVQQ